MVEPSLQAQMMLISGWAVSMSLTIVAIVVPLNVVFGLVTALALARGRFPGRGVVQAIVDIPFAVYNAGDTGTLVGAQPGAQDDLVFEAPNGRPFGDIRLSGVLTNSGRPCSTPTTGSPAR